MSEGKIAVRYAKALFEAASDNGALEKVRGDIEALQVLDNEVPEFRDLLESPVLSTDQKHEIFTIFLKGKVEALSLKFVLLITENKREAFLPSVCRVFNSLYKKDQGIKAAMITTAGALHEPTAIRMKASLEEHYKCNIELETKTKAEIIGGFVLRVDDQQLDASVATQLRKIRKSLDHSVVS